MGIMNHDPYCHSFPRFPLPRLATKPPPGLILTSQIITILAGSGGGWMDVKPKTEVNPPTLEDSNGWKIHLKKQHLMCRFDVFSHAKKEDIQLLWINWLLWIVFKPQKAKPWGKLNWRTHRRQKPMISPREAPEESNPARQQKNHRFEGRTGKTGFECWLENFQHNLVYTGCTYVLILVVPKPTMGVTLIAETWLFLPITCEQPLGFRTVSGEPKAPGICCEGTSFGTKEHITIALKWS